MSRPKILSKDKSAQINITVPLRWKERLEEICREKSYKENRTITTMILIRELLSKEYNLDESG